MATFMFNRIEYFGYQNKRFNISILFLSHILTNQRTHSSSSSSSSSWSNSLLWSSFEANNNWLINYNVGPRHDRGDREQDSVMQRSPPHTKQEPLVSWQPFGIPYVSSVAAALCHFRSLAANRSLPKAARAVDNCITDFCKFSISCSFSVIYIL